MVITVEHWLLSFNGCLNKQISDKFGKKTNLWPVMGDQSGAGGRGREGVIGWGSVINTECSKRWNLALPFFFQFCVPFIPTSLLLPAPLPHYLSPLSHHCCDYGCHAAVKRSTINRPEIKPKNEFPQCRPHALLSRNYLAGERLIIPLRRQHRRRDSAWLRLAAMAVCARTVLQTTEHRTHGTYCMLTLCLTKPSNTNFNSTKPQIFLLGNSWPHMTVDLIGRNSLLLGHAANIPYYSLKRSRDFV